MKAGGHIQLMDLRSVLSELLSSDTRRRDRGQVLFQRLLSLYSPEAAVHSLLQEVDFSSPHTASLALVLLKSQVLETGLWRNVSAAARTEAKQWTLRLYLQQPMGNLRGLLVATMVAMYEADGQLEDVVDLLQQWLEDNAQCRTALGMLESAIGAVKDKGGIGLFVQQLIPRLCELMKSEDISLRLSVCKCTVLLFSNSDAKVEGRLTAAVSDVVDVITVCLKCSHFGGEDLLDTLHELSAISDKQCLMWGDRLRDICSMMVTLAQSSFFNCCLRLTAVDLLTAIVRRNSAGMRSHQDLASEVLTLGFALLLEEDELRESGCSFLRQACIHLACDSTLSHMRELISSGLQSLAWEHQRAALRSLSLSSAGFRSQYELALPEILQLLSPYLVSHNTQLMQTAFEVLDTLCAEFEPEIQLQHHSAILPMIATGLSTEEGCGFAAVTLTSFLKGLLIDGVDSEFLCAYSPALVGGLESACKESNSIESALEAAAVLATVLQHDFAPYFPRFLSVVRTTLISTKCASRGTELRASCITAIGNLVESVSEVEQASPQAEEMLAALINLSSTLDPDNPAQEAIDSVFPAFSALLKDRFAPYLKCAAVRLIDKIKESEIQTKDYRNTFPDQRSNKAIQALYSLLSFCDYRYSSVAQLTIDALLPFCRFHCNHKLCKYALKTVGKCVSLYTPSQYREALLRIVLPDMIAGLKNSMQPKYVKWVLRVVRNMLDSVELPGVIGLPMAMECASVLAGLLSLAVRQRQQVSDYSRILTFISEIVSHLLRGFKLDYHSCFKQYFLTFFEYILQKPVNVSEVLPVVTVLYSSAKYTGDFLLVNSRSLLLEKFLACARVDSAEVQKAALAGVELCAELARKEVFAVYLHQSRAVCEELLDAPAPTCYCAVATLGVIILRYIPELKDEWLQLLPLESDCEEAKHAHHILVEHREEFGSVEFLSSLPPEVLLPEDFSLLHSSKL